MHTVSFLLLPGFSLLEVSGALEVLKTANGLAEMTACTGPYHVRLIGTQRGAVQSSSGVAIAAAALPRHVGKPPQTLVVAAGPGTPAGTLQRDAWSRARDWLACHQAHVERGAVFGTAALQLLAEAVLTPAARAGERSVEARDAGAAAAGRSRWVSSTSTTGIDVALSWIEQDHGRRWAETIAARLPAPGSAAYGPAGFRSMLIERPPRDERIAQLHLWITLHLREPLTVERLAAQALMSWRTFARHYRRATGLTPARAVEQIRLDAACRLIETSTRPLKAIAAQCGYSSHEVMRRAFVRNLGMAPAEYRRQQALGQASYRRGGA
jgi:transcriptional regulator GlxA family with amidase domain